MKNKQKFFSQLNLFIALTEAKGLQTEMTYNGFETLPEALNAHLAWVNCEKFGKRLNLHGADLHGAELSSADLSGANLSDVNLNGAGLRYADLSGAKLDGADLSDADLRDVKLSGAYLSYACLSGANISRADLSSANLNGANLSGANLSYADLNGANLRDADLTGADLNGADLNGADLRNVYLRKGLKWERYLSEIVPALLTAGGKTLEEVVTQSWDCHSWENCPMAVAFSVHTIADIPPLYKREAELFVMFFDAKQIPNPLAPKTDFLPSCDIKCSSCEHVQRQSYWRNFFRGFGSILTFRKQSPRNAQRELDETWAEHEYHRIKTKDEIL